MIGKRELKIYLDGLVTGTTLAITSPVPPSVYGNSISLFLNSIEWTPDLISNLEFWLDSNDINTLFQDSAGTIPVTADGQNIGAWLDKNAGILKGTQTVTNKFPLYKENIQNSKSGILFDGTDDYLILPDLNNIDGAITLILVIRTIDQSTYRVPIILSKITGNTYYTWLSMSNNPFITVSVFDTTEKAVSFGNDTTNTAFIHGMTNIEGSPITAYRNGVSNVGVQNLGTWGGHAASRLGIWRDSVNYPFSGYIHEVLIYSRVLNDTELNLIWKYLGDKWAIPTVQPELGNPLNISDNLFWFDSTKFSGVDGENVYVLPDLSNNKNHAIQNTLTKQGIYKINIQNSLPGVLLDGTDDFYQLVNQDLVVNSEITVFGVFKILAHSPVSDPMLLAISNLSRQYVLELFYSIDSDNYFAVGYDGTSKLISINSSPLNTHIFGASEKENDYLTAYLDTDSNSISIGSFTSPYGTTNVKIGANIDGLSRWTYGYLLELMGWNRVLTTGERDLVVAYLTNKWL